ncbi:hypothetical protein SeMB42_g00574 [Synchytrium endobioticum]|uniref:Uncharacterized protein n=1 Tax=Synchytrium endobioticum TaxID=286115 RepID=A0A507DQF0_9FUNG|nr:hypothetical protein SeMB42_g00574 [Synchytrium endobioticum]
MSSCTLWATANPAVVGFSLMLFLIVLLVRDRDDKDWATPILIYNYLFFLTGQHVETFLNLRKGVVEFVQLFIDTQKALKRHARRYTQIITYDEYMTSQRCSHCARTGVPEAVADDPRLSGYARAQGKSGHVLMAKRTRANRLASVLEDAGCFGAQHCQPLHAVRGVPEAVADDPRLSGYVRAQGKSGHVLMAKRTRANRLASVLEDAGCFGAQHCQPLHSVRYCEICSTSRINHDAQFFKMRPTHSLLVPCSPESLDLLKSNYSWTLSARL